MNNKCPCPSSIYVIGNPNNNMGPTGPTGPQGEVGNAPTFEIGQVVTGVPGSQAMVFLRPLTNNQENTR